MAVWFIDADAMSYAIVQTNLDFPDREAMRRAFLSVPSLTPQDADILGADAFGILTRGRSAGEATEIVNALQAQGIRMVAVPEADLPELPQTMNIRQISCTTDALVVHDSIGRESPVSWSDIQMIAVGSVVVSEFNTVKVERQQYRAHVNPFGAMPAIRSETVTDFDRKEQRNQKLLLEIIHAGGRYSIMADEKAPMLFGYLGARRTRSLPENFTILIRDLMTAAPEAALNRGAYYIRENTGQLFSYPSKNAFYEEIIWLLWAAKQNG